MRKITNGTVAAVLAAMIVLASLPLGGNEAFAQDQQQPPGAAATPQVPQPAEGGVNWPGVGYGAGALFSNVLYIPAKLVYALLGGIVGGGAWCLTGGNTQTAETIWRSSLGGDYVVTPAMISGDQPLNFSGPTDTAPPPTQQTVAPITNPQPEQSGYGAPAASSTSGSSGGPAGSRPLDSGSGPVRQGGSPPSELPTTTIE